MTVVSIHQPQFIPYIGFFHKVAQSNIFVILDDVEATRKDFTNRNRVKGPNGANWITVPVKEKNGVVIRDMEISSQNDWKSEHLKTIQYFYGKCPYFSSYYDEFQRIYRNFESSNILELDTALLQWIFSALNLDVQIDYSSKYHITTNKSQRLVDICRSVEASTYISGPGGRNYLESDLFKENSINLEIQDFHHPVYPQRFEGFMENLSVLDLLFNCGEDSYSVIMDGKGN